MNMCGRCFPRLARQYSVQRAWLKCQRSPFGCHQFLGDPSEEDPPVPIPNTAVKLLSPDGTARASVWESRTSPGLIQRPSLFAKAFRLFLHPFPADFVCPAFPARVIFETRLTSFRESGRVYL